MVNQTVRYPVVLFDWGDTVMLDDPALSAPMVEWLSVTAVPGIEQVLAYLQASGRQIILATSADVSDEEQIRGALRRVRLADYFTRIYCSRNTQLPKGEAFYRHILHDLGIATSEALMVGDHFDKDVLAANAAGIFALWFHPESAGQPGSQLYRTIHSMPALHAFFRSLDET
jgi:FMN phosphatase YigB (HAD superfamily)